MRNSLPLTRSEFTSFKIPLMIIHIILYYEEFHHRFFLCDKFSVFSSKVAGIEYVPPSKHLLNVLGMYHFSSTCISAVK